MKTRQAKIKSFKAKCGSDCHRQASFVATRLSDGLSMHRRAYTWRLRNVHEHTDGLHTEAPMVKAVSSECY